AADAVEAGALAGGRLVEGLGRRELLGGAGEEVPDHRAQAARLPPWANDEAAAVPLLLARRYSSTMEDRAPDPDRLDVTAALSWMQSHPDLLRTLLEEEAEEGGDADGGGPAGDAAIRAHLRFLAAALEETAPMP